jgi:hypothetical protein
MKLPNMENSNIQRMIEVLETIYYEKFAFNLIFFIPQHILIKFWFAYSSNRMTVRELSFSILYTQIIESINIE